MPQSNMVSLKAKKITHLFPPNVATVSVGLDGSGSHREIGKSTETSILSVMFGASNIREFSDGEDIWSAADDKGHSSPR